MSRRCRVQLQTEWFLEYPLIDLDCRVYTGPEGMGLSPRLDERLRDLQSRWQSLEEACEKDGEAAHEQALDRLADDFDAVELDLATALQGTRWVLVKRGERTEEGRRRRRKGKRKRR